MQAGMEMGMGVADGALLPPPPGPGPDGASGSSSRRPPERHANLVRFQSELEFVQCLANPLYMRELYIQGILDSPEMINYLKYLEYWRSPEYVRFIVYPTCLVYLTLLQQEAFRARLGDPAFIEELKRVGIKHHETWRLNEHDHETQTQRPGAKANGAGKADDQGS